MYSLGIETVIISFARKSDILFLYPVIWIEIFPTEQSTLFKFTFNLPEVALL